MKVFHFRSALSPAKVTPGIDVSIAEQLYYLLIAAPVELLLWVKCCIYYGCSFVPQAD
jgi:hypothetical protein